MNSRYPIDHVGVAVASIEETAPLFELLTGASCSPVEELDAQGVNVAFVGEIELLEPRGDETPVGRFLERRGPGLHHVALRVPDASRALQRLLDEGLEAVDEAPRPGARGHTVAFLHPRSAGGVLVELVERDVPSPSSQDSDVGGGTEQGGGSRSPGTGPGAPTSG